MLRDILLREVVVEYCTFMGHPGRSLGPCQACLQVERSVLGKLKEPNRDQPRTMCNKHGWFDYGPCKYCVEENEEMPICGDPSLDDGAF